jgi:MFS family permease
MSGLYAGLALGGIGGYVATLWGWRYGFQLFGAFGLLYAFVLLYLLKDHHVTPEISSGPKGYGSAKDISPFQAVKVLFAERSFYVLMFYFGILGMVNWLVYGWLPTFLKAHFNLSLGEAGISATGYVQVGSFIGVLLGGLIADRWFRTNKRSRLYIVIIGFTLGSPFLFLMSTTAAFSIAVIAMIIYGVSRGINDANLMPILSQTIDARYLATGYGCLNFLSTIVGGIMVYLGGRLKDAHVDLSVIYQVSAVAMLLACWSLVAVRFKNIE